MSKNNDKVKSKLKHSLNFPEKIQNKEIKSSQKGTQLNGEEKIKKNRISIKDQNAKDKFEYAVFKEKSKLLSDYYAPNITLKNLNITLRCLSCYKIPKIRFNYPNFKVFVSCPKHRKSLSYQEFLEKGYNNDLINVPCCKCGKKHNYMVRGSFYICLQCNKIFCPECSTKKEKCEAYSNNNTNSKKEKKNFYINNNEEQQSKTHILIKLDIYDNKCHLHQGNQFSLYCPECQCELCSRCQENHTKGHKIKSLSIYTVNNKFIEICLNRVKNEKDNIELVEHYISCFDDKIEEEKKMKKDLLYYITQDKYALDIKECILKCYKEKRFIYNAIKNVRRLKYPWLNSINPMSLDKLKNKKEIYKNLNLYLLEGNLNEEQSIINDINSQDDSDSSEDNISFFSLSQNNNRKIKDLKEEKINICFNNNFENEKEEPIHMNITKKNKKKEDKNEGNIKIKKKSLSELKQFICEQDDLVVECLLGLKNSNFAIGLLNGGLHIYKGDLINRRYIRLLKIEEHKSGINSLFEMSDNLILTASSDRLLKIINLLNNNTAYKVECILNSYSSSVYKGIYLKTKHILSCGVNDYLVLWLNLEEKNDKIKDNINDDDNEQNKFEPIKFTEAGLGISDIIETKTGNFVCASDILQFWTFFPQKSILNSSQKNKNDINTKNNYTNKIINDSTDSQISNKNTKKININYLQINNKKDNNINGQIDSNEILFNAANKQFPKISEKENEIKKVYINNNEYYERVGILSLKTAGSNCLCRLNSRYLFVILSEEQKGNIAIVDTVKIECINIIEVSKFEITSISNFNDDSIIISCTEKIDETFVVFIKQYQISRISGLKFVSQKIKKLCDYYLGKKKENNKKDKIEDKNLLIKENKILYDFSKRLKEQINCITYTNEGILVCVGKIESPEKSNIMGEINLFL